MTSIEAVRQLARTAHADQRDKQGRDYVDYHLAPIAERLREHGEHAEMAGWLHDIVEDTPTTLTDLLEHGIPPEVVRAVDAVTRRGGESYDDLITRAAADPLGRVVKIADNETNMSANAALAQTDPELAERLRTKYERARTQLDHHPSTLFVVHGRIESLTHDVAIIPTDAVLRIERTWHGLTPAKTPAPDRLTDGWARWGTSPAWLIDVTARDFTTVLDSLRAALHDIAEQQPWRTDPTTGVYGSAVQLGGRPLPSSHCRSSASAGAAGRPSGALSSTCSSLPCSQSCRSSPSTSRSSPRTRRSMPRPSTRDARTCRCWPTTTRPGSSSTPSRAVTWPSSWAPA
ncbi:hypothetical protein ON003_16045 [Janibacter hoylei]|uniref:hypothetical protein n=1 Tax=Janibacter hoylei TaxID=364298 RepID=UPI0022387A5B|nr:hypothetical protein [Janibacter hoylei]MCW4602932.1 hypothetical protein [Janibacter hoylei]